jgi:lipoprotein-anchoring transpeptidase ErfK/SrfK
MMAPLPRRTFLKLSGLSLASLTFGPYLPLLKPCPPEEFILPDMSARITTRLIYLYQEPDFKSPRLGTLKRDDIVQIMEEIIAPKGPSYNPRWYHLEQGYIHSAYTQRVDHAHPNQALQQLPDGGQLGEITLPFIDSARKVRDEWRPLWRLYYESVHWITHLAVGPDGLPWYGLTDELLHLQYYIPASAIRPIQPNELTPLSPEVPDKEKRIEVSIPEQLLFAYEGEQLVRECKISSGLHTNNLPPGVLPTDTPAGYFHIQVKVPSKHMGDGRLTSDILAYELPGVPWVSFFHKDGIAFHGTYWHDNFGRKMSHGCVNMRNEDAKWFYRWSQPSAEATDWNKKGWGTVIRII